MSVTCDHTVDSLSVGDLSQVLAKLGSARAIATAACTSRLWRSASHLAFRELCISTGRQITRHHLPSPAAAQELTKLELSNTTSTAEPASALSTPADWRQLYFEQSYALSFNGINDYVSLPPGLFRHSQRPQDAGLTVDIMFLAHAIPQKNTGGAANVPGTVPGGGMLFGLQDREFGRSRRAARLSTFPLLYIGTDGRLHSALKVGSLCIVADGQWHRATLTLDSDNDIPAWVSLYIDGQLHMQFGGSHGFTMHDLPSYAVLGSGVTEGWPAGGGVPVYNCHTFHGLVDELRLWTRPLKPYEVRDIAWRRMSTKHDMPYSHLMVGSWSLTEGKGYIMHEHIYNAPPADAILGAVAIPSAHRNYHSVSSLVHCLPASARASKGPAWVNSTAPVEGQLVMEYY